MLDGDFSTAELDSLTAHLVSHFHSLTSIDTLSPSMTEKDMMD